MRLGRMSQGGKGHAAFSGHLVYPWVRGGERTQVYLVCLVHLVRFVSRPNKPKKPDRPDKPDPRGVQRNAALQACLMVL